MLIIAVMRRSWALKFFPLRKQKRKMLAERGRWRGKDADNRCNVAQLGIQMMQVCMERRSRTGGLDR